jgi:hypothetical protein
MAMLVTDESSPFKGPGKTTYTFSVMFCFLLRPFSVLPAGGGRGSGGNRKFVGVSGKRIRYFTPPLLLFLLICF